MSADTNMTQTIDKAIAAANYIGTRHGFEMGKLAIVGLLYDEMTAAAAAGRDVESVRLLLQKVRALQLPKLPKS